MQYYILKNNKVQKAESFDDYMVWVHDNPTMKVIGRTTLGDTYISTVFLMIDHSMALEMNPEKPVVFETMIFYKDGNSSEEFQERYTSYADALKGHEAAVRKVIKDQTPLLLSPPSPPQVLAPPPKSP